VDNWPLFGGCAVAFASALDAGAEDPSVSVVDGRTGELGVGRMSCDVAAQAIKSEMPLPAIRGRTNLEVIARRLALKSVTFERYALRSSPCPSILQACLALFEFFDCFWPVVFEQLRKAAIHQQPSCSLALRTIVALVVRVANALHR
jgi:hypothetical protein